MSKEKTSLGFKRSILAQSQQEKTTQTLQQTLFDLVDLALQGKQAHWNVVGAHFRSVHLQLDEIIDSLREASDEVAERIATLGVSPEGRSAAVAEHTRLEAYPAGGQSTAATVSNFADRLASTIQGLRQAIETVGELDPISEDLLIGVSASLEKHLWMLQAQED
ncbi:DNA starvation/stationary phase protection protein Dps [Lignipirellula cremea]|uniref:Fine tangled pili major subunit n=1 Tax=Lignipirellula cremea TaxID=2528010 RepID=A0A518DVL8_9BACT|nr:DNA starvation/stationary phase protection protein Dps [Lignipirellula cremea]QDU95882.1 Fine tangled pili major subunit [Lignipirellula cremea]